MNVLEKQLRKSLLMKCKSYTNLLESEVLLKRSQKARKKPTEMKPGKSK